MPVRILLLEDDDDLRFVLSQLLEAEGYAVEAASRGEEAVRLASQNPFDLVVADIRMEGLDGLDALAGVKEHQPDVRALVVTGYSTEADSIRAIRLGVGDYLKKPFELSDFLQSVARLVAERRHQEARRQREQTLLRTLKQALEGLARSLDMVQPERGILTTGRLALRLAQTLGMSAESIQEVELASLLAAIAATGIQTFSESELPAGVVRVLHHLEEAWDGSGGPEGLAGEAIPFESRVAAVALAAGRGQSLDARFDPRVVAALDVDGDQQTTLYDGVQRRGLLSLGRALEAAGQLSGSEQAYQLVGGTDREGVEGLLGLARLAKRQGQAGRAAQLAQQARELAQQVGPLVTASTLLEVGILLGGADCADMFRQAGRLFQSMRVAPGEAQAVLALHILGGNEVAPAQLESSVSVLTAPEQSAELAASATWLMPFVLSRAGQGSPIMDRAATRMVREFQRELCRQLSLGQMDVMARVAAATALGSAESAAARLLAVDPEPAVRAALKSPDGPPPLPLLRIYSFGPMEVFRGDEAVEEAAWRGKKTKFLLAMLASQAGRPLSEDVLIDTFWPEDVEKGRRSLYWSSSVLRRCVRPAGAPESIDYLPRSSAGLRLNPDLPRWHDLEEMQLRLSEAARHSQAGRPDQALDCHRRVVALYRGPYLESCYMDWSDNLRTQSEHQVMGSLSALIEGAQLADRHLEVLEHSQRLLELDPCRQEAALAAMQALIALGRPEEAVRRYEACNKALKRELDMEAGIPLLEAFHRAKLSL